VRLELADGAAAVRLERVMGGRAVHLGGGGLELGPADVAVGVGVDVPEGGTECERGVEGAGVSFFKAWSETKTTATWSRSLSFFDFTASLALRPPVLASPAGARFARR
jgi:hypothetical protein